MGDPGHRVAQPLQNHVHLISGHRFPLTAVLNIDQAFRYLLDAPQIVKQLAPMSWTYVQTPQDGTVWLEWLPPNRNDARFPSDGYVWADPEQTFRQDIGGYTLEVMIHTLGYRPNFDAMACHARTRYHLVAKNPSVNAPPPDSMLWIVHYHPSDPTRALPVNQVPPTPQMQQTLSERRWLESQGRLDKKDFMLHDQDHWPHINVPSGSHAQRQMQQAGFYGNQQMANAAQRQPPYAQPGGYPQQPPQKRQRQQGPIAVPGSGPESMADNSLETEENTTLGDFFDHLTPRDISMARYMQHHRWMEEIFSSPYDSHSIVPADLGLGLMGELKGLTEGILDPPALDFLQAPQNTRAEEIKPFTHLRQEQLDEFSQRVEKHLRDGQAEIERMKAEHAAKMKEWKTSKALVQAEKKLRNAVWERHNDSPVVFRLEEPRPSGQEDTAAANESVEDIVKATETLFGVHIRSHKEASMISPGGLEEEPELIRERSTPMAGLEAAETNTNTITNPSLGSGLTNANDTLQVKNEGDATKLVTATGDRAADSVKSSSFSPDAVEEDAVPEGMDLDIQPSDIDFAEDLGMIAPGQDTPSGTNEPSTLGATLASAIAAPAAGSASQTPQAVATPPSTAPVPSTTTATAAAATVPANGAGEETVASLGPSDAVIFNDNEFADLADIGDGGDGDGLVDFDSGMGLEESAFGDALHGMDGQEGGPTPGGSITGTPHAAS